MAEGIWIGVDAGKAARHATAVDAAGSLVWSRQVANDRAAIEKLLTRRPSEGPATGRARVPRKRSER